MWMMTEDGGLQWLQPEGEFVADNADTVQLWVYTPSREYDYAVEHTVGRDPNGGGTDLDSGERDLSFEFKASEAELLGRLIVELALNVPGVQRVQVI